MRDEPQKLLSAARSSAEARDRAGCELIVEVARAGREVRLKVQGTSMLPSIRPGDILVVKPERKTSLGAVALVRREGRLFAHRAVRHFEDDRGGSWFVTRGDTLRASDPPVPCSDVLGRVMAVVRDGNLMPLQPKRSRIGSLTSLMLRRFPALIPMIRPLSGVR